MNSGKIFLAVIAAIVIVFIGIIVLAIQQSSESLKEAKQEIAIKGTCDDNGGFYKIKSTGGHGGFRVILCNDGTVRWKP